MGWCLGSMAALQTNLARGMEAYVEPSRAPNAWTERPGKHNLDPKSSVKLCFVQSHIVIFLMVIKHYFCYRMRSTAPALRAMDSIPQQKSAVDIIR